MVDVDRARATKRKYQGDHFATVSASIPIDEKIRFQTLCAKNGTSMHAVICGFVAQYLGYLSEDPPIGSPEDPTIPPPIAFV